MLRVDMHTTVCGNRVYNSWIRSSGYDALSYAWGDTVNQQWIVLNGSPVRVRKNLHDALLELRERGIKGPIWIDALCINQSNKLEKAQQLPLMNFIYDQADTVYVWLGAGAEHKDVTQGLLLLVSTVVHLKPVASDRWSVDYIVFRIFVVVEGTGLPI